MTREYLEKKLAVLQHEHRQLVAQIEDVIEHHGKLLANKQAYEGAMQFAQQVLADMPAADAPDPPKD